MGWDWDQGEWDGLHSHLQEVILDLEPEIPPRYKSSGQEFDKGRGAQFANAEESLAHAETMDELYRKRYDAAVSTVNTIKSSIGDMFTKIGCDTPAVRELLGDEVCVEI